MAKKVVRLDEQQFNHLVKESVSEVLNEIGYRTASLPHGANYNAQLDCKEPKNPSAKIKMGQSENISIEALSLAIKDNFPNLIFQFVEHNDKTNRSYPVDMNYLGVKYYDKQRIVFIGDLIVSLKPFGIGTIEYNFNTQEFYRVSYSDKTTNSRKLHSLIVDNDNVISNLLTFISNFLYSEEDYEHNVDTQGSTPSKRHLS